ncbi:hypothetical protein [Paenibacillus sp. JCM 10914]|uniref:hypothetical protein n=1 Tax=Paenibacillus sp. JCM 10914 TaxID=1236974 RepID=UPI001E575D5E|nr:hypothetical protein [Paenibacillus sp. JCM 10914]
MWMNWIYPNVQHERHAFQTELNQLESAEAELAQSLSPSSLMIARSMMHLFLEEDREALDLLRQAEQSAPLPQAFSSIGFKCCMTRTNGIGSPDGYRRSARCLAINETRR